MEGVVSGKFSIEEELPLKTGDIEALRVCAQGKIGGGRVHFIDIV